MRSKIDTTDNGGVADVPCGIEALFDIGYGLCVIEPITRYGIILQLS
jgi:hypothetical protein